MTRLPPFMLYWAAVPAVVLSVWFLHIAEAPRSVLTLQILAASFATVVFVVLVRMRRVSPSVNIHWFALALTLSLFLPLLAGSGGGTERWLVLGSIRLYVAPVVLPVAVFFLGAPLRVPAIYAASVIAAAIALVLQPDASQLSAFALAMLVLVTALRSYLSLRVALLAVLLSCAVVAWQTPDPLAPVRYVEGVFDLAADVSAFALLAALISAVLPVIALVWVVRGTSSSNGGLAVGTYYASLLALAPLQVTPVPLLGFGAGSILGYFLVAGVISRARANHAA